MNTSTSRVVFSGVQMTKGHRKRMEIFNKWLRLPEVSESKFTKHLCSTTTSSIYDYILGKAIHTITYIPDDIHIYIYTITYTIPGTQLLTPRLRLKVNSKGTLAGFR